MNVPAGQSPGNLSVVLPTPWKNSNVRAVIESCSILALLRQNFWIRLCRNIEKVMGIETVRGQTYNIELKKAMWQNGLRLQCCAG